MIDKASPRWWIEWAKASWWRLGRYTSGSRPIVVGGCGRSGTTLLRVILDSHPHICCGPESGLFLRRSLTPARIDALSKQFDLPAENVRALARASRNQAEFVDGFFASYCATTGKSRWAEKTPRNVRVLPYIFRHFPDAVFVHVIRDGRDVACSLRTHPRHRVESGRLVPIDTWNPFHRCVERWVRDVSLGLRFRGDPRYRELRYEALVAEPRRTLERLFADLDEPFDERVLAFSEVRTGSRDPVRFPQNPEATGGLTTTALGRWKSSMDPSDARVFKRLGGDLLVRLGYEPDQRWETTAPVHTRRIRVAPGAGGSYDENGADRAATP